MTKITSKNKNIMATYVNESNINVNIHDQKNMQ